MEKKKILVLVDWFAPGYKAGGPIQSCVNFAFTMKNEFAIYVLTTDTDHGELQPYPGVTTGEWSTHLHPDIRVCYLKKAQLKATDIRDRIQEVRPDYVYLNHLFSPLFVVYPLWLKYTGSIKCEIVLSPRGALYDSALSVKPWKKTPFIRLFRWSGLHRRILFHATNERERTAVLQHFPGSRVLIADNLPNAKQPAYTSCLKEVGTLKCIFVARIVAIKNLLFLLQVLRGVHAKVELTIVGPEEDKVYWNECLQQIGQLGSHVRVDYRGPKRNDELMGILQEHHLFILPTAGENFGHSIFEALLAGRPVLISDQTPWLGLSEQKVGWDLPLEDQGAFLRAIEEAAEWNQAHFDEWGVAAWNYARNFIENPDLQAQYLKLFA